MISRRAILGAGAACLTMAAYPGVVMGRRELYGSDGLHLIAKDRGLFFGAAVADAEISSQPSVAAIVRNCGVVVGQRAMKWPAMWSVKERESPDEADRLAQFAESHQLLLRGHALIFDAFMPEWVGQLNPSDLRAAFDRRIDYTVSRFKGRVHSWDVVNEAVEPNHKRKDGLRDTVFMKKLGPEYIADAFFRARENDPSAMLCYNEYGLESDAIFAGRRRAATLRLLENLKKRGAPIDALGVQGHLKSQLRYNDKIWRDFLAQIAQMGLKIIVSELDVYDYKFPGDISARDRSVADMVSRFLAVTLDERSVIGVVTWGLSDSHSWMLSRMRKGESDFIRADGALPRPLPLDAQLRRKPMWYAIAHALNHAPRR